MDKSGDDLNVNFVANAGVKDIVGRGLIYNDNVAIIELVKNSKDADSLKVVIDFVNPQTSDLSLDELFQDEGFRPEIIIKDFGKGLTRNEIKNKWLNIAYSEKKNKKDKNYAGNKGVGRFSCDRLGKELNLFTKSKDDTYLSLKIDWTLFENKGETDLISSIPLIIEELPRNEFLKIIGEDTFDQGTVLKITNLRTHWPEKKLKKLISELEKFSPSLDSTFKVIFNSNGYFSDKILIDKVNRKINNSVLEKLIFKTTHIKSQIDESGQKITTSLVYQGENVFSYTAENPYSKLKSISVEIHYLDTLSKSYFTKNIGAKPNLYGSVFLFYNAFRVSPYGNAKNDWLGLDQRKSQGTSRNLGTRDIVGRIDINDEDESFSVITSREGLVENIAYEQLVAYDSNEQVKLKNGKEEFGYVTLIIRQLENFVVKGIDWNRLVDKFGKLKSISADDALKDPERFTTKTLSVEDVQIVCNRILKSNLNVTDFQLNTKLIKKIEEYNSAKYNKFITDFIEKSGEKELVNISTSEMFTVKKILNVESKRVESANEERNIAEKQTQQVSKKLKIEQKKKAYLLATRRTLSRDADGLIHTMKINNIGIKDSVDSLIEGISYDEFSQEEIIDKLSKIKLYAMKTLKMAELATRSGFDRDIDIRSVDIVQYCEEYLDIYKTTYSSDELEIKFISNNLSLFKSISVLNFSIIIDNLLSNSSKWGADVVTVSFVKKMNKVHMKISDNGLGLSELFIDNPEEIFELGARDTPPENFEGSGIGLHYSKILLKEMNACISFEGDGIDSTGASFEVVFN